MDFTSASSALDTLLILSRTLTGAKQGGLLADALDLLLAGVGCSRGAAYSVAGDALELVGERGLPLKLRMPLERLPLGGPTWTPAQAAAQTRKLVVERDLGERSEGRLDRTALALAKWGYVVACPIASGREVYGVLLLAWPSGEEPDLLGRSVIEIACNMIAVQMARRSHEQRQAEARGNDARAARMAALGIVAGGVAEEIEARLADAARSVPSPEALQPAREATARFLAAIAPSTPERLDLGALVADAIALAAPPLARRRIEVELHASGEHPVVGRRSELIQLFLQIVLGVAGALDDADGAQSDRSALIPRAFGVQVERRGGNEVVTLRDADEDGLGARASFFEIGGHARTRHLDLGVAQKIVIAHEGHIEMGAAGASGGTQCTVVLPAAATDEGRRAARSRLSLGVSRPRSDRPRPVVLWVDEDDLFLEIMVQSFPELDVRVARSAAEATQFFAYGTGPSRIFCNVRLPDLPAHELHAELARHSPKLAERFVFVADGVLTPEIAGYLIASGLPTVMRPIDVAHVREICARDAAAPGPVATTTPTLIGTPAPEVVDDPRRAPTVPVHPVVRPPYVNGEASSQPAHTEARITAAFPPAQASTVVETPKPPPQALGSSHPTRPDTPRPPPLTMDETPKPPSQAFTMGETPKPPPQASGMREHELAAIGRAAAQTLQREGPKRGAAVIAMLRERGLSEGEALAVITFALSTGILVRDPPPSSVLRAPDGEAHKTVLVVDDDFDLRQTLREVLQDEGYVVETASNGKEALDLLHRSNPPRVMVLDLMMPVMDGWQLLQALEGDDTLSDIPVVVISAGKAVNAPTSHDFLSKPLDYYKLVTTLERSMARPAATR